MTDKGNGQVVRARIAVSIDGFSAGPNQGAENPLGEGGERLHDWALETEAWRREHGREGGEENIDSEVIDEIQQGIGAVIMGRNMFGPGRGEWDLEWKGWWGDEPPFHVPVFVLTHYPREAFEMKGGTTFTFVTDGIESALEQARAAAGDDDILIAGGAETIQQYLAADLADELFLHVVPVLLGDGDRLLENVGDLQLQQSEVVGTPAVTHIRYAVG